MLADAKKQIDLAFTRKELRGLSFENAFAGANSFMRRKYTKDFDTLDLHRRLGWGAVGSNRINKPNNDYFKLQLIQEQ